MRRWDYAIRDQTNLLRSQSFEGDFFVETLDENRFLLDLVRMRGRVDAISVDPASNDFETKQFEKLDVLSLRFALATGSKTVIKVETRDGDRAALQLLGVKEVNGKVNMAVKAIGEDDVISQKKMFKKAKMEIDLLIEPFIYLPAWSSEATEAIYDSRGKTLNFANDVPPAQAFFYWAAAQGADLIELRFGPSGEEKVVAKVEWVKADSDGLKVKLSNKEIKGLGKTAKNAITALDKLKSGSCSVKIHRLADASYMAAGAVAFDALADWLGQVGHVFASDRQSASRYVADLILLDVEGVLKKTKRMGEFELEIKTKRRDRILYINKDDKDTVRSKSVTSYLKGFAEKYDEPFRDDSSENEWWLERQQKEAIIAMKTDSGESVLGMLTNLRWNVKKEVWQGTASLGFAEAEKLQTRSTLDQIWIQDWGWQ
jgi:hypothetical protein